MTDYVSKNAEAIRSMIAKQKGKSADEVTEAEMTEALYEVVGNVVESRGEFVDKFKTLTEHVMDAAKNRKFNLKRLKDFEGEGEEE